MFFLFLNRYRQLQRKAFLIFQVILFSETYCVLCSNCINKSPQIHKYHQITSRPPTCSKLNYLSNPTSKHLFSYKKTTVFHNKEMSGESDSAEHNDYGNSLRSLPENLSVHTANITEVHNVPIKILIRPFPSVLDEDKVLSLMETIENPDTEDQVPPIDIMWVKGREGGDYYYSFGGCHRYEAYKRLNRETIPCKLFKSSMENLRPYLGASTPDLL